MKAKKLFNIWGLIVALLLTSLLVSGYTNYSTIGGNTNYFQGENSLFTSARQDVTDYQKDGVTISNPKAIPLVEDLDNDGINEIVALGGNTLRLYHYSPQTNDLTQIDSYTLPSGTYGVFELFDIDNDNYTEIITLTEETGATDPLISIVEYNGTDFYNQTSFNAGLTICGSATNDHPYLKCGEANECFVAYHQGDSGTCSFMRMYAYAFNSTQVYNILKFREETSVGGINYQVRTANVRNVQYIDYDGDLENEYIVTFGMFANQGSDTNDDLGIYYFGVNSTGVYLEDSIEEDDLYDFEPTGANSSYITNSLCYDFDVGGDPECVIAFMTSDDTFKMYMYDSSMSEINEFPELQTSDGIIISDMFLANAKGDGDRSACVMGTNAEATLKVGTFTYTGLPLNILCGSLNGYGLFNVETIEYTAVSPYNLSWTENTIYSNIVHTIETDSTNDYDEVMTPYGVYKFTSSDGVISGASCLIEGGCLMTREWIPPYTSGAWVPVDYSKNTRSDFVGFTTTNLYYLDDKFTNQYPEFVSYTFNPCLPEDTIKINETIEVTTSITDPEEDNITLIGILYADTTYEQIVNYSGYYSSGTEFTIQFTANVSGTGTLRLIAQDDVYNNTYNVTKDFPFSVASTGVSYGDSICTLYPEEEEDEEDTITDDEGQSVDDNLITSGSINLIETLNLGIGIKAFWIFIMIAGIFVIVSSVLSIGGMSQIAVLSALTISVLFLILMIILGFFFGIFGWGVIALLIIPVIAIVVLLALRPMLTGGT